MEEQTVELQTKLGWLRGHTKRSIFTNKIYYAFQGIPYAKPPIGNLRFKAPQPYGSWKDIRDALEDGNDTKQANIFPRPNVDPTEVSVGDEDCLYLNVFMNELPDKSVYKKPVMFSIHGGGFSGGSGGQMSSGPDFLLYGDVVFVSCNYRCGAFGFLSLENEVVPGNAGLKDQTLALKWVQNNIESFGGDPNNVTIFGISAGGASVHFHLLSPLSRGLFHKAIIQSGFSLNPWAIQRTPQTSAIKLAKDMGCTSVDLHEILLFLQSVSADDIVEATIRISKNKEFMNSLGLIFTPTVEVAGEEPFLVDSPDNLMKKGEFYKVPVIFGGTMKEGSVVSFFDGLNDQVFGKINENPQLLVPTFLGLDPGSDEIREVERAIWDFYFKGSPLSWNNVDDYLTYQSDVLFNIGMDKTRSYLLEMSSAPAYSYLFTNHSRCICVITASMFPQKEHLSKIITQETCHGADCLFLYTTNLVPSYTEISPEGRKAIQKLVRSWTNFALVGDPNCTELEVKWEEDSETKPGYMDIGTTWEMKRGIPYADSINFWKEISLKFGTI